MTILELREKRAKAWEAAKAFLDSHRNEKGVLSAEDDAAYTRMEQEITDLGTEIARMERQELPVQRNRIFMLSLSLEWVTGGATVPWRSSRQQPFLRI